MADDLVVQVYALSKTFPREELFGLTSQMRRGAVSVASNIVEGCARNTQADYVHFLIIAYGSVKELEYQASLSHRLGFLNADDAQSLAAASVSLAKTLNALIASLRDPKSKA